MKFTNKAVEMIEQVTGQKLTDKQIRRGTVEFTIKSQWSFLPDALCKIDRDEWGNYRIIRAIPEYGRIVMADGINYYQMADTNNRLNKRLVEVMNY